VQAATESQNENHQDSFRGTNISRPPTVLIYQSKSERVTQTWGPERIETGWWRGRTTCRDYWRVETETGKHLWVFRDLRKRKWFVQGEF
jgi:protein ImuB